MPITHATIILPKTRQITNFVAPLKATYVENSTIGLMIGAVNIKAKAVCVGTSFNKLVHNGYDPTFTRRKENPRKLPTQIDKIYF